MECLLSPLTVCHWCRGLLGIVIFLHGLFMALSPHLLISPSRQGQRWKWRLPAVTLVGSDRARCGNIADLLPFSPCMAGPWGVFPPHSGLRENEERAMVGTPALPLCWLVLVGLIQARALNQGTASIRLDCRQSCRTFGGRG
jgi:hypothetical protein